MNTEIRPSILSTMRLGYLKPGEAFIIAAGTDGTVFMLLHASRELVAPKFPSTSQCVTLADGVVSPMDDDMLVVRLNCLGFETHK